MYLLHGSVLRTRLSSLVFGDILIMNQTFFFFLQYVYEENRTFDLEVDSRNFNDN